MIKDLLFDGPVKPQLPKEYSLGPVYPNPFNSSAVLAYSIPSAENIHISLYDIAGRELLTLFDGVRPAGSFRLTIDGSRLASGTYMIRFEAGKFSSTVKAEVLK